MAHLTLRSYSKSVFQNLCYCFKKQKNAPIYRISSCGILDFDCLDKIELVIEIIGKREAFTITPVDLYKDDRLLSGFSPIEARTITILALIQEGKYKISRLELESIKYDVGKQKAIFFVKETGEKIEKNISDLPKCTKILNELSPLEAFRLGMSYEDQKKN